ncbi:MAG: DUF3833 domain-containing protein [Pseudomonadota bacterium]
MISAKRKEPKRIARRWRFLALGLALFLLGCSSMKIEDYAGTTPEFRPERFFEGETQAWGFFQDRFGTVRREFFITTEGTVEGDVLTLIERFAYSDGINDERTWTLTKTGAQSYEGTAHDVIGTAEVTVEGRAMRMAYDLNLKMNGREMQVHFVDWLFMQPNGVLMNKSTVSKFGVTIGEVIIFFQKVESAEQASLDQPKRELAAQ